MRSTTDPVWTERPNPVSRENPLGVTTTRNLRLLNDLVFSLQSDAITYRFRYLSFWAWILQNTEQPSKEFRARYEKVFFLANMAHDCPDDGHSTNGIVGAGRTLNGEYLSEHYDSDAVEFDIADEEFALTNSGGSGFDQYYQSIMQQLWLIYGEQTLTPIGEQLAQAFDNEVDPSFDRLQEAVSSGIASQELVQELAVDGCCCQILGSDSEREILTKTLLANFKKTEDPDNLAFKNKTGGNALSIESWYPRELETSDDIPLDFESIFDTEEDTDLVEYFEGGFGARTRGSCILFLAAAERVKTAPGTGGLDLAPVEDIRRAWEFFVHTHYFVVANEILFKAWLHALRHWGPVHTEQLLHEIFASDEYIQTVVNIAQEYVSVTVSEGADDQFWRVLDAIYYNTWFDGRIQASLPEAALDASDAVSTLTWGELQEQLPPSTDANQQISATSARVLHDLAQSGLDVQSDAVYARSLAAIATVMLALLYRRGEMYQEQQSYDPYRRWYAHVATSPSPLSLWQVEYDDSAALDQIMKPYTKERVVRKHWSVTQEKIQRSPSRTPRHMLRQPDGRWEFKSMYQSSHLYQSWIRIERLIDVFYELGLTTSADMDEFRPSTHGKQVLQQYGVEL